MASPRDRAAVVLTTITSIYVEALRAWLRGEEVSLTDARDHAEAYLRDEFDDAIRQVRIDNLEETS